MALNDTLLRKQAEAGLSETAAEYMLRSKLEALRCFATSSASSDMIVMGRSEAHAALDAQMDAIEERAKHFVAFMRNMTGR